MLKEFFKRRQDEKAKVVVMKYEMSKFIDIQQARHYFGYYSTNFDLLDEADLMVCLSNFIRVNSHDPNSPLAHQVDYIKLVLQRKLESRRFRPVVYLSVVTVVITSLTLVVQYLDYSKETPKHPTCKLLDIGH